MGSAILSGQLSWYWEFPGCAPCFEAFWLPTWPRFIYTDLQHRGKCLGRALPGMAAPPGSAPLKPLVLGFLKAGVWSQASQQPHNESAHSVTNPKSSFTVLCLYTWVLFVLALGWSICSDMPYSEGDSFMWGQESAVFSWLYLNPT